MSDPLHEPARLAARPFGATALRDLPVRRHVAAWLSAAMALAACTGGVGKARDPFALAASNPGGGGGSSSGGSSSGGSSSGGSSSGGSSSGGSSSGGPDPRAACGDAIHPAATDGRRITFFQYQRAVSDIFDGRVKGSAQYPTSYGKSATGYSTEPAINGVGEQDVVGIQLAAEEVAASVAGALSALLPCAGSAANEACANTFLDKYARRAYRRPLASDERAQLLATFRAGLALGNGAAFADAIALMVDHMLQAPQFLYVMEDAAPAARALSGDEIASRLSFLFWDSVPDDELLAAAAAGRLSDRAAILAQATRMLASEKANTAIARLFREWTLTKQLGPSDKDSATFPDFDAAFAQSMNDSFDKFVLAQVRAPKSGNDGSLTSLLRSTDAYIDAKTAQLYGVPAPASGQWAKVSLDGARYSGISTQAALVASLAHPSSSSYVFRGKFVITRLLCGVFGTPPVNSGGVFDSLPMPADPTGKDVSAKVRSRQDCASCHTLIDPPGLAFEHFDALGRYRDGYSTGKAIDPAGTLPDTGSGAVSFQGPADLMEALSHDSRVAECFAKNVFRFAMSRAETPEDQCALQALGDALQSSGGRLADTLLALTTTDAFTHRIDP